MLKNPFTVVEENPKISIPDPFTTKKEDPAMYASILEQLKDEMCKQPDLRTEWKKQSRECAKALNDQHTQDKKPCQEPVCYCYWDTKPSGNSTGTLKRSRDKR
jgi:hypothetical protein